MTAPKNSPIAADPVTMYRGGSMMPVPDPTALTTAALSREINALKELFEIRLNGLDRATDLLQAAANRGPSINVIEERVSSMATLVEEKFFSVQAQQVEKFDSIQVQFRERDTRGEQTSRDSKIAIDAALQAAKEAVGKSEVSTIKSIDQIVALIQTMNKASDDKMNDIKDRFGTLENKSPGQGLAAISVILAVALVVAMVVIGVMFATTRR